MKGLEFVAHSCFRITAQDGKVIYTDPFQVPDGAPKADLILITHEHYDHFSAGDISKILKPDTIILATARCKHNFRSKTITMEPGREAEVMGIKIKAVPAYNTTKQFHPKANKNVGYVFQVDGKTHYFAGDTDMIPEMAQLGPVDVALVPVSGVYVMDAEEAAEAVNTRIKPGLAIPMHYGASVVGKRADAELFAKLAKVPTEILR